MMNVSIFTAETEDEENVFEFVSNDEILNEIAGVFEEGELDMEDEQSEEDIHTICDAIRNEFDTTFEIKKSARKCSISGVNGDFELTFKGSKAEVDQVYEILQAYA